jgi:ABC-type oligopeptide transport system ATPase subunit
MSKITEVELKGLQEQEQKKGAILHDLGLLQTQTHSLNHMYVELMVEQDKTKKELEETYGKVNINLQDGSFELIKEDDKENK